MNKQLRNGFTMMMLLISFSCSVIYLSCTKSDNTSTTRIKCVTCAHGGLCINDTCHCPAGYEGSGCQTEARNKFQGSWVVTETGTISPLKTYNISISSLFGSGANITNVSLSNLHYNVYSNVTATVSHDSLIIPLQYVMDYNNRIQKIEGVGYIHSNAQFGTNGAISMRYYARDTLARSTDDFGYISSGSQTSEWTRF